MGSASTAQTRRWCLWPKSSSKLEAAAGLPGPPKGERRGERQSKEGKRARLFQLEARDRPFSTKEETSRRAQREERFCGLQVFSHILSKKAIDGKIKQRQIESRDPQNTHQPLNPHLCPSVCLLAPCYLTGDSVRDKCVEMLSAALKAEDDYKDYGVNCDKMASEIEDHIYQELKSTDMKYRNRVRSRISNLKDPRNPSLRRNVLSGAISAGLIAKMTAEEMASDELRELRNAMTQEAIREHQMAKTGGTTTDLFQCSKCKKKNCTYNQVQTRSADEPMTTFVLCNECGNRWKFC